MAVKFMNKEYDAVVFDLDGTVYPLPKFNKLRFFLLNIRFPFLFKAHREALLSLRDTDFGNSDKFYDTFFSTISQKTGKDKEYVRNWYFKNFYNSFEVFLKKYCCIRNKFNELVTFLKNKKVKLGILSDYANIENRLDALRVEKKYFDIIVSGENCGALKPLPRSLSLMIEFLGIVPEKLLVVGDRIDTDGMAAKNTGTGFFLIKDNAPATERSGSWNYFLQNIMSNETATSAGNGGREVVEIRS